MKKTHTTLLILALSISTAAMAVENRRGKERPTTEAERAEATRESKRDKTSANSAKEAALVTNRNSFGKPEDFDALLALKSSNHAEVRKGAEAFEALAASVDPTKNTTATAEAIRSVISSEKPGIFVELIEAAARIAEEAQASGEAISADLAMANAMRGKKYKLKDGKEIDLFEAWKRCLKEGKLP